LRQRAEAAARAAIVREAEKAKKKKKKKKKKKAKKAKKKAALASGGIFDSGALTFSYTNDDATYTVYGDTIEGTAAAVAVGESYSPIDRKKVENFKTLITEFLIPAQENLSRYKNRRVTPARRSEFQTALDELDLN